MQWLYDSHPEALLENLKFIPQHTCWKDLTALVQYLVEMTIPKKVKRQTKSRINVPNPGAGSSRMNLGQVQQNPQHPRLEGIARGRQNGSMSKEVYLRYLRDLPSKDARKDAKKAYHEWILKINKERKESAVNLRKSKKKSYNDTLSEKMQDARFSAIYHGVVSTFVTALKNDVAQLKRDGHLEMFALAAKWAPSIPGAVDAKTNLGKHIARALFAPENPRGPRETKSDWDTKAFISYRKDYLTPLRAAMSVTETLMTEGK